MNLLTSPEKFVLWIRRPEHLEMPVALVSAVDLEGLGRWRSANRWADPIPLVGFGSDEMAPLGMPFQARVIPNDGVPWRVENAPPGALGPGWVRPEVSRFDQRLESYVTFARRVVGLISYGPVWCVGADADGGVLALAVAAERRRCVALAASPPGVLAAAWGSKLGVSISERESSDANAN